ncbi:tRNA dimethylallyltransferase-like, partial [Rhopilema esculentum]
MAATTNLTTTLCKSFKYPIIVILGSTGVGKTKLSIELAKKVDGEIISADSMQVYKGLDVVTAKATQAERAEIKHHMIDMVNPLDSFSVVEFRNMALPIISDISSKGKVPIIVGGTNYYIESLLWNILVTEDSGNQKTLASDLEDTSPNLSKIDFEVLKDQSIYKFLQSIDPVAASKVHPNDSRKVKRKLEIWKATGKKPSDVIVEQQSLDGGDHLGGPLRFTNSLVF